MKYVAFLFLLGRPADTDWPVITVGFDFEKPRNNSQNGSKYPPHATHFFWPKIHGVPVRPRPLRERDVSGHRSAGPQHVVPGGWDSGLKHTLSYFETSSMEPWGRRYGDRRRRRAQPSSF